MVSIFYTIFGSRLSNEEFSSLLSILPQNDRNRIQQFKRWQDRQIHLAGRLLLLKGLIERGFASSILESIETTPYGRPYINEDIDFSLSNSGMCAVCAITENDRIGIDVEHIRSLDTNDFKSFMNLDEWNNVQSAKNRVRAFYSFWTKKEAILKADGRGFSVPSEQIRIGSKSAIVSFKKWLISEIPIESPFICHLSTCKPAEKIFIHKIFPKNLINIFNIPNPVFIH